MNGATRQADDEGNVLIEDDEAADAAFREQHYKSEAWKHYAAQGATKEQFEQLWIRDRHNLIQAQVQMAEQQRAAEAQARAEAALRQQQQQLSFGSSSSASAFGSASSSSSVGVGAVAVPLPTNKRDRDRVIAEMTELAMQDGVRNFTEAETHLQEINKSRAPWLKKKKDSSAGHFLLFLSLSLFVCLSVCFFFTLFFVLRRSHVQVPQHPAGLDASHERPRSLHANRGHQNRGSDAAEAARRRRVVSWVAGLRKLPSPSLYRR
jgi:hypothetical protein